MEKWCTNCESYNNSWCGKGYGDCEEQCWGCNEYTLIPLSNDDNCFLSSLNYQFSLPFLSCKCTDVRDWLEVNYPFSERKNITDLDISNRNLKGYLNLSDFVNLKRLNCSSNRLTKINLSNCSQLKFAYCCFNKLTKLDLSNCSEIIEFCCNNNYLSKVELSSLSEKLELLDISNNNLSVSDLFPFSRFTNLEILWLGNNSEKKLKSDIFNRFVGCLKPLNSLTKLKHLDISNLGTDSDLEYLPNSLQVFMCSDTKHNGYRKNAQKIIEKLSKFSRAKRVEFSSSYDFATNLKAWKKAHSRLMLKVEKENNQANQKKIIDLEAKNCQLLNEKNAWEKKFPGKTPQQVNERINQLSSDFVKNWAKLHNEKKAKELAEQKLNDLSENIEEIIRLKSQGFELEAKGYSKGSIKEIKNWNLLDRKKTHIPDLTVPERRGVAKMLSIDVDSMGDLIEGHCGDLVVFLVPFSSRLTSRTIINRTNLTEVDSHLQIEYSQGIAEETKQSNNRIIKQVIKSFLQNSADNKWEWDIYVLVNKKTAGKTKRNSVGHKSGTSADSALYLALTSAYLGIPLSDKVAITGTTELAGLEQDLELVSDSNSKKLELKRKIEELKETSISQWKIKAIGGVGFKVASAVESGAEFIILPEENRNDYEREVSDDVKAKIEKVIFIQRIVDLDKFLNNQQFNQEQLAPEMIQELQIQQVQSIDFLPSSSK